MRRYVIRHERGLWYTCFGRAPHVTLDRALICESIEIAAIVADWLNRVANRGRYYVEELTHELVRNESGAGGPIQP